MVLVHVSLTDVLLNLINPEQNKRDLLSGYVVFVVVVVVVVVFAFSGWGWWGMEGVLLLLLNFFFNTGSKYLSLADDKILFYIQHLLLKKSRIRFQPKLLKANCKSLKH